MKEDCGEDFEGSTVWMCPSCSAKKKVFYKDTPLFNKNLRHVVFIFSFGCYDRSAGAFNKFFWAEVNLGVAIFEKGSWLVLVYLS